MNATVTGAVSKLPAAPGWFITIVTLTVADDVVVDGPFSLTVPPDVLAPPAPPVPLVPVPPVDDVAAVAVWPTERTVPGTLVPLGSATLTVSPG